jgi:hypothetical protein
VAEGRPVGPALVRAKGPLSVVRGQLPAVPGCRPQRLSNGILAPRHEQWATDN